MSPLHSDTLHRLSTLLLPAHVQNDELAQRFRNEKYVVRMSRSGSSLLVGWLTEGVGGEPFGAGEGFTGERGKRGRAAVMKVVNNHLRFDGNSGFRHLRAVLTLKGHSDVHKSDFCATSHLGRVDRAAIFTHPSGEWHCCKTKQSPSLQLLER